MLPERLSTDLTSLGATRRSPRDRRSSSSCPRRPAVSPSPTSTGALVHNHAKLAYNAVGAWLDGAGSAAGRGGRHARPGRAAAACRTRVAQALNARAPRARRARASRPSRCSHEFDGETLRDLQPERPNRATIADREPDGRGQRRDGALPRHARLLRRCAVSSDPRAVGSHPSRWPPNAGTNCRTALMRTRSRRFSLKRRAAPIRAAFPDLSRTVIKLLGSGEYVRRSARRGTARPLRSRGAVTTPTRRRRTAAIPDLITQRLLKAALAGRRVGLRPRRARAPRALTARQQEDAANKVERQVRKSAAALLVRSRIGRTVRRHRDRLVGQGHLGARPHRRRLRGSSCEGGGGLDVGDPRPRPARRRRRRSVATSTSRGLEGRTGR